MDYTVNKYKTLCSTPSDINEHLVTLEKYARECESIFETGVRGCVSSWAFLHGLMHNKSGKKVLFMNDIDECNVEDLMDKANLFGVAASYEWKNNLELDIETNYDITFIDTWHVYGQLKRELDLFSKITNKYIIMHDTTVDEWNGETIRMNMNAKEQSEISGFSIEEINKGLWPAIDEFLAKNPDWKIKERFTNNNGLTILYKDISDPFISVDYWFTKCDLFLDTSYKNDDPNYDYTEQLANLKNKKRPIILIQTDTLPQFMKFLKNLNFEYILLTISKNDYCAPTLHMPCKDPEYEKEIMSIMEDPKMIRWYTINPGIVHKKLQSVPIGPKWQWETTTFFGEPKQELMNIYIEHCLNPKSNMLNSDLKTELLYFNFNSNSTDNPLYSEHKNIRNNTENALLKNDFSWNMNQPFSNYIATLKKYKFSVSPPGRGIDTHRTWESLMVGTIPIIIHTTQDHLFEKLPVIIIQPDEWNTITQERLENEYEKIIENIDNYNFDILYTHYWDKEFENIRNT